MKIGIVGCGVISKHYVENSSAFDAFELVACADLDPAFAEALAADTGLEAVSVDELIADPALDAVLNLTPPAAHVPVTMAALAAGKHVYTEKPLATQAADAAALVAEAERRGLLLGCAPDIFLGGAYQAARGLIDEGAIGEPVAVSAAMLVGGADAWHPSPEQFFQDGAGPLLDMGPYYLSVIVALLGPISRVAGFAKTLTPERSIAVGPRAGGRFSPTTPTHVSAALELESGATANLVASFEATDRYVCDLEIHGREGVLALPDPNSFEGPLRIRRNRGEWEELPYASRGAREARGIGLNDLAEAVAEGRAPRASGLLAAHVVDVARSVLAAAAEGETIDVTSRAERPEPLPVLRLA
jgi:predicted dehydrogenase